MIVFLVGGESRLMDALITKMEKDGHKTYLLTGKRDGRGKYRRVFERYNFPYDSESVREIFTNVNPDLVIFLGAYDTNYDWSDARRESVRYTADLTNLLSAYAFKQNGRFVYLSSEVVYGRSYSSDIHETEPASSKSFQAMAILQGENICKSYRDTREMDTRVLRFDHMYDIPRKGKADNNPCFQMMLEMLKTNQIAANSRNVFSMIYQSDADGQHDVCNIPKIYQRLKEKDDDGRTPDIVLGSRFMKGSTEFEVSFAKKMAFVLFRKMLYLATGRKIADPTTGLQGLSRKAVLYYSKYNHFDDKYPDTNMITQMLLLDFKVVEIPAVMHARTSGKSMHSGLKPIWYMMRMFYSVLAVIFRCKVLKMDAGAGRIDVEREDKKYPELAEGKRS